MSKYLSGPLLLFIWLQIKVGLFSKLCKCLALRNIAVINTLSVHLQSNRASLSCTIVICEACSGLNFELVIFTAWADELLASIKKTFLYFHTVKASILQYICVKVSVPEESVSSPWMEAMNSSIYNLAVLLSHFL